MRRTLRPAVEMLEKKALLSGSGLAYSLTATPTTSASGTSVVLTFTETNVTNHVITTSHGPTDDGFIATENGKTVWISNNGINPFYIQLDTLKPGDSVKVTEIWNGRSDVGGPGFPGQSIGPVLTGTFVFHNELDPNGATATVTLGTHSSNIPTVVVPPLTHIIPPRPPAHEK